MRFDRVLTNPPFSINWGNTEKTADGNPPGRPSSRRALPLRPGAAGRQEGRPDVPAAHAGRHARRRHGRHRDAARRAVPRRRGTRHPRRHHRSRPAGSRDRPAAQPVLRHRHPRLHPGAAPAVQNGANRSGKPAERQGKVLFINADREFFEGRAQNYLLPEHIEKIVTTFDDFRPSPGFSAIVTTPRCARTTTTSTSAATPTTRRRPSRTTCAPIWWAACPRPRWPTRPALFRPTA
jgi:type I restriction enzyme M protein